MTPQGCERKLISPPVYEDPPPYSDGRYLMVSRRLVTGLVILILLLLSLIVALLIKHCQLVANRYKSSRE